MLDLQSLNENQLKAVSAPIGSTLVVAGAGTGKTRVLTMRMAYLIEKLDFDSKRVLAITFTNRAANEMRERVNKILGNTPAPWIGTYHATCLRILREDINALGRDKNFNVIDDEDQTLLIKNIYHQNDILQKTIQPNKMLGIISKIKFLIELEEFDVNQIMHMNMLSTMFRIYSYEEWVIVKKVYKQYQQRLLESNLLDYDDLLILTYRLLLTKQDIKQKWQNLFQYILVDEFQDTNKIQFEILNMLINPTTQNVFVVGDPDQTIYNWRGAYADIFEDFLASYKNTKTYILDLNYRSVKSILNVANALIINNSDRIEKELVTNKKEDHEVNLFIGEAQIEEANFICHQISQLTKSKKYQYRDMAILYRSNYISRIIEQALINNSIPYYIYGGYKFYQRMEIKDLLAYLRLMVNDQDDLSLRRIINAPRRNIGLTTIKKIDTFCLKHNLTFAQALQLTDGIDWPIESIKQFNKLINDLKTQTQGLSIAETIKKIIDKVQYREYLNSLDFEERNENVVELINAIDTYEKENSDSSIEHYLQEIALYTDSEDKKKKENSISLMTIHTAKGTEFPVVFITALNEGVFPPNEMTKDINMSEERRVAYVGITRAMQHLYITSSHGVTFSGKTSPSRFIYEIGLNKFKQHEFEHESISNIDLSWYDSKKATNFSDNYNKEPINFQIGDTVVHTTFGSGLVIGINNGDMLEILFKAPYGRKILMKTHKALKRLRH